MDWEEKELGEIVNFAPKVSLNKGNTYAFVAMEDINPVDRFVRPLNTIIFDGSSGSRFTDGSILFARITPCLENRKIAQVKTPNKGVGIGSTEFFVFGAKDKITELDFLYYLLKTDFVVENGVNSMVGASGRQRADWDFLKRIKIKFPPLSIQRRIADVLGRYDALIENYQRQISLLEAMTQEIYREWFVRGRCPYAQTQANKLPTGWVRVRLGEILELKYGKSLTEEARINGDFPVVGSSGIVGYHSEFLVDKPGIVVGRKGNVGSVYWIDKPFYPIDTVFYVKTRLSLFYLFFNLQTQNLISGDAAVPGLNREQALFNEAIKPSDEVLERFDKIIRPIFSKIGNLQTQITQLRRMRDKLLPRLMSGQLEVAVQTTL